MQDKKCFSFHLQTKSRKSINRFTIIMSNLYCHFTILKASSNPTERRLFFFALMVRQHCLFYQGIQCFIHCCLFYKQGIQNIFQGKHSLSILTRAWNGLAGCHTTFSTSPDTCSELRVSSTRQSSRLTRLRQQFGSY